MQLWRQRDIKTGHWICTHCCRVSIYSISQEICTRFLLLFFVVIHWLIFPYPSGLLHWHCGNLTIAPVPAKQPWWIWINTSYEFIRNDCITTTKQSTTKPCAYFLGYTVIRLHCSHVGLIHDIFSPVPSGRRGFLWSVVYFAHSVEFAFCLFLLSMCASACHTCWLLSFFLSCTCLI